MFVKSVTKEKIGKSKNRPGLLLSPEIGLGIA
jgi:hypothetical protein